MLPKDDASLEVSGSNERVLNRSMAVDHRTETCDTSVSWKFRSFRGRHSFRLRYSGPLRTDTMALGILTRSSSILPPLSSKSSTAPSQSSG